MKILFAGSPEIAVPSLTAVAGNFHVVGVLTAPDKTAGRGGRLVPPPVKERALTLGIRVLQPRTLNGEARERVAELGPDLLVVFAYGRIFGPKFLSLFPLGGVNMHPSALPRFRGPSPLTAAILAGDARTALTVQRVSREMDAGDILRQTPFPLNTGETTGSLAARVGEAAGGELVEVIKRIISGTAAGVPQDHSRASYCGSIKKEEGLIDWNRSARHIERMVRAYQPWPKARTTLRGAGLTLLESEVFTGDTGHRGESGVCLGVDTSHGILIQAGEGILAVKRLQSATRKPMDFRSFLNGFELRTGTQLGGGL